MKAIADTGFIVAFVHSDDKHHEWALDVAARLEPPALTCEAALAEAAHHLRSADVVLNLVHSGLLSPKFEVSANLQQLMQLAARYGDREPDLADLCLIRMSELHPRHVVITTDKADFQVYRRNKRDMIPVLTPP